jgi:MFS family permease
VQIPGGQRADRHGARPVALASLVVMTAGNALLLAAPEPAAALALRAVVGLGTGVAFVAASDYVRAAGGGAAAQGIFGGSAMGGGGLALAVVPALHGPLEWRAPYASATAAAGLALLALAVMPRAPRARPAERRARLGAVVGDRRLHRLAVAHMASLGLNAVVANWVVTLLERAGGYSLAVAGAASALTLGAGIVGRPLGGWLAHRHPARARGVVATSLLAAAVGTALLVPAGPLALVLFGSSLVGLAAGLAFAPVFTAAAALRPDGPGAAVGFVNMAANLVIVAGTPLLGLSFGLPGDGRLGFVAVAVLWAAAVFALPRASELSAASSRTGSDPVADV